MKNKFALTILAACLTVITACVKDDFDNPVPVAQDPVVSGSKITIDSLKKWFVNNTNVQIDSDVYVVGTVIGDDKSGNIYKELIIQDSTAGISILLDQSDFYTDFPVGRRVYVKCKNLFIGDYNDVIQLGGYVDSDGSLGRIASLLIKDYILKGSYYYDITPIPLKPSDLNSSNYMSYINRLVVIDEAEFATPDTVYADAVLKIDYNLTISTCNDGGLILRNSAYSDFASNNVPDGNGKIIAIMQVYHSSGAWELADMQLKIRDESDLQFTGVRCGTAPTGGFTSLDEDFSGVVNSTDIALGGWLNLAIQGTRYWRGGIFSGNGYAQATAFSSGLANMETWLITPELNLSVADTLTFESAQAFWVHDGLTAYISTNFDGTSAGFASATWTPLTATLAGSSTPDYDWVLSGTIPLTAFSGSGYIGFKYSGNTNTQTTTYRVDNVVVH